VKRIEFYIIAVSFLFSCTSHPKGVISEKKMTNVLYEMYLSDAVNGIKNQADLDSAKRRSYRYILHKYDVSAADFDSSMVWYASQPDKQERLYNRITEKLQSLQVDVAKKKYKQVIPLLTENDTIEIWKMPRRFDMIAGNPRNNITFFFDKTQFQKGSVFLLTYHLKINKDDKSKGNRLIIKTTYANNKVDSLVSYCRNDGAWRKYRVVIPIARNRNLITIGGSLLDCKKDNNHQSAIVKDVSCYRILYAHAAKTK
jgi:hypothetical protein